MAKNIRWQIPFVSDIDKTKYRIDIYDEGTFTPVQLKSGPTPFVTNENNDTDFFAPVRSHTGTIQVCTAIPGGGTLSLNDILPANNIARPVRLVSISGSTETIKWQGFLSCEAYTQDYIGIPQNLDIPVISVLEAMDSVQVTSERFSGLMTVASIIANTIEEFIDKVGNSYPTAYYVPTAACGRGILSKYIDSTFFFDMKEQNNENGTTYVIDGISLKDCLERIATYMGWIVREQGIALYFMAADEETGYNRRYRQDQITPGGQVIYRWMPDMSDTSISVGDIASMQWLGIDHKRSIAQGAKSVKVVASLEKYKLDTQLPPCPIGSLLERYTQLWKYAENGDWLYLLANSNATAYSNIQVAYYSAQCRYMFFHFESYATTTLTQVLSHMAAGASSSAKATIVGSQTALVRWYAGAFLCKCDWESTGTAAAHNTVDALYCVFFAHSINSASDFDPSQVGAIFSINSVLNYRCNNGYIQLSAQADTVFMWPSSDYTGADLVHSDAIANTWYIAMELSIGDKWWNGSSWQDTQCTFNAQMTKNGFKSNWVETMNIQKTEGLLIPVTENLLGVVTLKIWPMASSTSFSESSTGVLEMIFSQLTVHHILPDDDTLTDRSENHYFRLLGINFNEEVSINPELASMLNNLPSPSLIMNSESEAMTELNYGSTQSPDMRRPEVDLLDRLAAYYGAARQRLELIVAHPTAAPLPLLRLNGINDGKVYLPLSESRDWKADTSTLTCFETPGASSQ